MGRKEKSSVGKKADNAAGAEDSKRDQKLQAILLADSFSKSFRPVTWEKPKVLLPLVNVPMLEYTIEFLAQNGVEEVFVFCVWHADMLQEYLLNSKWSTTLTVRCITSTACLSAGDALRELDAMGIIRSDPFILISGDVISNMDLKKAIAFHKEKRKEDNNAIMTVVLKQVQKSTGAKPVLTDLVVGLDRMTSQILLFEDNYKKSSVQIPLEIMADHPGGLNFRTDLLDCHVDICSPELMLQFSDNFDYQEIRRDFIQNEVVNWELGMHIYGYFLQNEYAARVHDLRTYHTICRDIVTRWVYPLVPDAQLLQDGTFAHLKRYIYKENGSKVSRASHIGDGCVLGKGCVIEGDAVLERTIVGRDCVVGAGAVIIESHLWAGCRVDSDAHVTHAIICDNAVVMRGAHIGKGCVLSYGVVVGEGVVVPDFTRISCLKRLAVIDDDEAEKTSLFTHLTISGDKGREKEKEEGGEKTRQKGKEKEFLEPYDTVVVGPDGVGYVWTFRGKNDDCEQMVNEGDEEDDDAEGGVDIMRAHSMGCTAEEAWKRALWNRVPLPVEEEYDSSVDDNEMDGDMGDFDMDEDEYGNGKRSGKSASQEGSSSKMKSDTDIKAFLDIIGDMVTSGQADGHSPDNLLMEIKGYKFAQNKSFSDCIRGSVPSLLSIAVAEGSKTANSSTASVQVAIVTFLKQFLTGPKGWGFSLLRALLQDIKDEYSLIEAVENFVLTPSCATTLYPVFRLILQQLYDEELITEDALVQWIASRREGGDESETGRSKEALFNQPHVQAFVAWIEEGDDSDDDDGEEEDDDEEED